MPKLGLAVVIATPLVTHMTLATGRHGPVAAALTAAEIVFVGSVTSGRHRRWVWLLAAVGLLGLVAAQAAGSLRSGLMAASGMSHAGLNLSLLMLFGASLAPGRTPLITALATRLRGPLSPDIQGYTRSVTWLWCGVFAGQVLTSAILLALAPARVWSLFVNVLDAPITAGVFMVEFVFRLWRFPHERHISPLAVFRSFSRPAPDAP